MTKHFIANIIQLLAQVCYFITNDIIMIMKSGFINEMISREYSCCFSDLYNGWNDTVGQSLNDKADSALSSAESEIKSILREVKEEDYNYESDMNWIDARLNNLK